MKIYECDFCQKQKPCTAIQIDAKQFDICVACRKSMNKKLENRGEPVGYRYMWNGQWSIYSWPQPMITTYTIAPMITGTNTWTVSSGLTGQSGLNSQVSNTLTCSNLNSSVYSLSGTIES